jgi:tetratricopeptide (TPR) repeat protein
MLVFAHAHAQSLRSPEYARRVRAGLDHLYRIEHAEAIRVFEELRERYPEHPGPPLSIAMAVWLEELFERQELDLDRFISPGYFTRPADEAMDESERAIFEEGVERSRTLASRWLERHPDDIDARYYLGACEAALGVFAFTIDRSYRGALSHGKKSYEIQKAIVEEHPDFADSYLTVGTYEYIVGNLPWYIKWIAAIAGYHGSEEQGFEYLVRAAKDGFLVGNDARVLLMVLYVREERHDYALQMAEQLHARYQENFLLHLNRAQILEKLGRREEAAKTLVEAVERSEKGVPNYQKLDASQLRYALGERLLTVDRRQQALAQFEAAIADADTPERDRVFSYLRAGEILEELGREDEARELYLEAQSLEDVDGSHRSASRRLRQLGSR